VSGPGVAWLLIRRELRLLLRQPARGAAALGTPLLIWVLLASGLGSVIAAESVGGGSYGRFLVPGAMTLVAVFASVFGAITVIEERASGWLRVLLVAPVPAWSIAAGRIAGVAAAAGAQVLPLLPIALFGGDAGPGAGALLSALPGIVVTCLAMSGLGLALAWRCPSTAAFHSVMNLVLLPMWLLSGAFFPLDSAAGWLRVLGRVNPLSWCTEAIRGPLTGEPIGWSLAHATAFALATAAAAIVLVRRDRSGPR